MRDGERKWFSSFKLGSVTPGSHTEGDSPAERKERMRWERGRV